MTNAQQLDKGALRTSVRINESKKQPPNDTSAFPDEIAHLENTRFKLNDAIKQANASVEQIDKEYMVLSITWCSIEVKSIHTRCSKVSLH